MKNTTIAIGTQCLVSSRVSPDGARTWHLNDAGEPRRFELLDIVPDSEDGITPVYVFWAPDGHAPNMGKYRHEIEPMHRRFVFGQVSAGSRPGQYPQTVRDVDTRILFVIGAGAPHLVVGFPYEYPITPEGREEQLLALEKAGLGSPQGSLDSTWYYKASEYAKRLEAEYRLAVADDEGKNRFDDKECRRTWAHYWNETAPSWAA